MTAAASDDCGRTHMDIDEKEYDRIAAEIRQNQAFRITLFTFSVTACAALLGLSEKIMIKNPAIVLGAVWVVLAPSIILVHHYTRSINALSEYLRVFHEEPWMKRFDSLTEKEFFNYEKLGMGHFSLQKFQLYTTGMALTLAYSLLIAFVLVFGAIQVQSFDWKATVTLFGGCLLTCLALILFRPLSKAHYFSMWDKMKNPKDS